MDPTFPHVEKENPTLVGVGFSFAQELKISYHTARKYLELLVWVGLLEKRTIWRSSYYLNTALMAILYDAQRKVLQL